MRLIDGDRIVTAQLYDDQYEEFKEEKMSIIDYVNMYTTEGVTTADDVIEQIRADIEAARYGLINDGLDVALRIIDKHTEGSE